MNEFFTLIKENFILLYVAAMILPLLAAVVYFFKNKNSFIYSAMFTKKLKRVSPVPGKIDYVLCEGKLKCYQKELTLKEDDAIIRLLENFNFEEMSKGNLQVKTVIAFLIKQDALTKFIRIILHLPEETDQTLILSMTNSELQGIFNDFFLLNPGAMQLLKTLLFASGISNMMKLNDQMEQNSSEKKNIEQKK